MPACRNQLVSFVKCCQFRFGDDKVLLRRVKVASFRQIRVGLSLGKDLPFDVEVLLIIFELPDVFACAFHC